MTEYVLYAHKNSYAMTTHLLLEELKLNYRVVWFNVHKPREFPPEFLELNPYGRLHRSRRNWFESSLRKGQ